MIGQHECDQAQESAKNGRGNVSTRGGFYRTSDAQAFIAMCNAAGYAATDCNGACYTVAPIRADGKI